MRSQKRSRLGGTPLISTAALGAVLLGLLPACGGSDRVNNGIEGAAHSPEHLEGRAARQSTAARGLAERAGGPRSLESKQILFGDLHVHTTY